MKPRAAVAILIAAAIAGAGCARHGLPARPPGPMASSLLAVAAELGTPPEVAAASWTKLRGIAERVAARQRERRSALADALNDVVMGELAFEREVDRDDLAFMLLPSVIDGRRGSCVGLGALYLALAEMLDQPLEGVLVPGHFFVRAPGVSGVPPRNVELLRRGEAMPEDWYRKKYGPWPDGGAYGRALGPLEVEAVFWFNAGNQRRAADELAGAEAAFARAAAAFPAMAEAEASLGVARHLRGALPEAADAYRAAARAWPDLPGLARDVTLLERERAGDAPNGATTPAGSPSIR